MTCLQILGENKPNLPNYYFFSNFCENLVKVRENYGFSSHVVLY